MFYDRFKEMCTKKGVSCNRAATEIGLSNSTATKWKKTGATPDARTIAKLAEYFDVTVDFLLTGDEKKPADPGINGLDAELIKRLSDLSPEEMAKVDAFVQGLLANRAAPSSPDR